MKFFKKMARSDWGVSGTPAQRDFGAISPMPRNFQQYKFSLYLAHVIDGLVSNGYKSDILDDVWKVSEKNKNKLAIWFLTDPPPFGKRLNFSDFFNTHLKMRLLYNFDYLTNLRRHHMSQFTIPK